jgi:hypothetical protein
MTFGTITLRALTFIGAAASIFWLIAFLWSAFVDPPPAIAIGMLVLIAVGGLSAVVVNRFPAVLAVPESAGWFTVLRRLLIAGLLSYLALAVAIYGVAASLFLVLGNGFKGETELGATILALWIPIWLVPLVSSVAVWRWSRI